MLETFIFLNPHLLDSLDYVTFFLLLKTPLRQKIIHQTEINILLISESAVGGGSPLLPLAAASLGCLSLGAPLLRGTHPSLGTALLHPGEMQPNRAFAARLFQMEREQESKRKQRSF